MGGATTGYIPHRVVQDYADRNSDDPEEMVRWVKFLDAEYVKQVNEQSAAKRKTQAAPPPRERRVVNKAR